MGFSLPEDLAGIAVTPGHETYPTSTSTFFRGGAPAAILPVTTIEQVQSAVRVATAHPDAPFSIRSAGHGIAGRSTNTGGIVLDLAALNSIELLDNGNVKVGPGARWLDMAKFLEPHGLGISSGDFGGVGVGGLATAGGSGWLVREHGLTIDHVQSAEMVLADGSHIRADATQNQDLFWAVRGAGASFGVVTSFEITPTLVTQVGYAQFAFQTDDVASFMVNWSQTLIDSPREVTSSLTTGQYRGGPATVQVNTVVNSTDTGHIENLLKPFLELGAPVGAQAQLVPYRAVIDNVYPGHHRGQGEPHARAGVSEHLTPELAEKFARMMRSGEVYYFQIRSLGGAVADVPVDATAFAHRTANFTYSALGGSRTGMNRVWDELRPHFTGLYSSFDSDLRPERLTEAYPGSTLERLQKLKRAYDPNGVFRDNRPFIPATDKDKTMTATPLTDQTTVINGATGNIGQGLMKAQLDAGASLVIVGRNEDRLNHTRQAFPDADGRITAVAGDVSTLAGADKLAKDITDQVGAIDHVVIGLNAWMQGEPFWAVSEDTWQRTLDIQTSYFSASRALAPIIRDGGSLTMIHGLAFHVTLPLASPISIYGGALRAMRPAMSQDLGDRVRVNSVAFAQVASPSRGAQVSPDWVTDVQAGQVMTAIAASDVTASDLLIPDLGTWNAVIEGDFDRAANLNI